MNQGLVLFSTGSGRCAEIRHEPNFLPTSQTSVVVFLLWEASKTGCVCLRMCVWVGDRNEDRKTDACIFAHFAACRDREKCSTCMTLVYNMNLIICHHVGLVYQQYLLLNTVKKHTSSFIRIFPLFSLLYIFIVLFINIIHN